MNSVLLSYGLLSSWGKFYSSIIDSNNQYNQKEERYVINNQDRKNIHIFDCNFKTQGLDGGAINIEGIYNDILIEECRFFQCKANKNDKQGTGGAIFIKITGNCVLSRICGSECSSDKYRMFGFIELKDDNTKRNEVYQSTFANCKQQNTPFTDGVLALFYGIIKVDEINGTMGDCHYNAYFFKQSSNNQIYSAVTSYSTFGYNTLHNSMCFRYDRQNEKSLITRCNIIRNEQNNEIDDKGKEDNNGLIFAWGINLVIEDSCIFDNKITKVGIKLIDVHAGKEGQENAEPDTFGSVIIRNCFSDVDLSKSINNDKNKIAPVIEDTPDHTFIIDVKCFKTAECFSSYDAITKGPACFTKELINIPNERHSFGLTLAMMVLSSGSKTPEVLP